MGSTRPPTDGPSDARDAGCLSPADRTAYALGEIDGIEQEIVVRHLLRCARCRADVDGAARLKARLAAFGRGGDWEADVGAALAADRGRLRVRRRAALSGFAAAAVAATVVGALWLGGVGRLEQSPRADSLPVAHSTDARVGHVPLGTAEERAQLLAAQSSDGRFSAATAIGGARHDEATTALAVLALVGEGRGVPKDAEAARAVAAAVRWLRTRQGPSGRFGPEATAVLRDQALATAAMVEVGAVTGDAELRASAERGVRALRRDASDASAVARDEDGGTWARHVLARARDLATGHASASVPVAAPGMDDMLASVGVSGGWPTGIAEAESVLGRTLAVVERSGRE